MVFSRRLSNKCSAEDIYVRDLIIGYKNSPILWQQTHPLYNNRLERHKAYTALAIKCQRYYPDADTDYVRSKINSLRTSFNKERKKVLLSKDTPKKAKGVYESSLWYYDLLKFTVGEETEDIKELEDIPVPPVAGDSEFFGKELLIQTLLTAYRHHPVLWDSSHSDYRNNDERSKAYTVLAEECQKYNSEADADYVRVKLNSLRTCFNRERKKIQLSKESAKTPEDVYKPSLWYYDLLRFTIGEDSQLLENESPSQPPAREGLSTRIPYWTKKNIAILIRLYQKHPCLYLDSHPLYKMNKRRKDSLKKICMSLSRSTGKRFLITDVKNKITLLRKQFFYEYKKKITTNDAEYTSGLWCYDMLSFIQEGEHSKEIEESVHTESIKAEVDIPEELDFTVEPDTKPDNADITEEPTPPEDIYDIIGKNLAFKLREMNEQQRFIADRIIREVMYQGQMENLTEESQLTLRIT